MEETYLLNLHGVKKKILAGGTGTLPHFPPGAKLVFHFQTLLDNFERTVIDDSRLAGRPAEIFIGKMFKMEVWETLLMSMRIGEVAEFWCDAVHTGLYPIVSKGMRLIAQGKDPLEGQRHMCGMGNMFNYHSTGYPELDELMRTPQPLIFIMELLQVGDPMSYQRESWMMEKDEKLQTVPILHMQGNILVKQRNYREAANKYKEAVLLLKTVQSKEMPGDIDYINLGRMIIPLELNYCQCMLELEEYYEVIEHTDELLEKHKDCVKGYYKRAKAHAAVWNEKEAKRDYNMVAHLDITLASLVNREMKALSERMKEQYWEEKEAYWNMLEKKEDKKDEEEQEAGEEAGEEEGEEEGEEGGRQEVTTERGLEDQKREEKAAPDVKEENLSGNKSSITEGAGEDEAANTSEVGTKTSNKTDGKDWQQMLQLVMILQREGVDLIKDKNFEEASEKVEEALEYVDFLQNKQVDPQSEDWESLENLRLPLTLNLSQCKLELREYQRVVELNSELLKRHKGHFKAVYQRARAHSALLNQDEARRDFEMVEKLDPQFKPFVRQEMKRMGERLRSKHASQNKTYWDTTQENWGPGGSKVKSAGKKKKVKSSQKTPEEKTEADKQRENKEVGDEESSEKAAPAETEAADEAEPQKNPDAKAEQREKEPEKGSRGDERLDNKNVHRVEVQEDGQAAADNRGAQEDSDPETSGTGGDNVVSKRSAHDKGSEKVKCQSSAGLALSGGGQRDRESIDETGCGDTQSE